jgi:adenine phosphoribosyltransferase
VTDQPTSWFLGRIDRNTPGPRDDVTPLFADGLAFAALVGDMHRRCADLDYEAVAGIDALGFILGAAMASTEGKGFIALRKADKLPVPTLRATFTDYSRIEKTLELRIGIIVPGTKGACCG